MTRKFNQNKFPERAPSCLKFECISKFRVKKDLNSYAIGIHFPEIEKEFMLSVRPNQTPPFLL